LKGWRFPNAADIIENAKEKLKTIWHKGLQEYFQHFYSCWQKRIFPQEDFPEGNVA
jgi:hypothetical protein